MTIAMKNRHRPGRGTSSRLSLFSFFLRWSLLATRQPHPKTRTVAEILYADRPAVRLDDFFHNRQTEAGTTGSACAVKAIEAFSDALARCLRDAGALVSDAELYLFGAFQILNCEQDAFPGGSMFDGVVEQICQRPTEPRRIRCNWGTGRQRLPFQ